MERWNLALIRRQGKSVTAKRQMERDLNNGKTVILLSLDRGAERLKRKGQLTCIELISSLTSASKIKEN